jgi:CheY-like chemotaxis protein
VSALPPQSGGARPVSALPPQSGGARGGVREDTSNALRDRYALHSGARHETVLIVENEENNRCLIEQILGFAGYSYLSATNGLEALDILAGAYQVDVVLLDLSMPILDGCTTTQLIRRRPECAALPVVAVTAHAMAEDRERALRCGCDDFLIKPFRPNDLLTIVARMLAGVSR